MKIANTFVVLMIFIFLKYLFQLGRLFQMLEGLGTKLEKDGLLERYMKPELNTKFVEEWASTTKNFMKVLPYRLTTSQLQATSEIIWDLRRPVPMNRLLQVWFYNIHLVQVLDISLFLENEIQLNIKGHISFKNIFTLS